MDPEAEGHLFPTLWQWYEIHMKLTHTSYFCFSKYNKQDVVLELFAHRNLSSLF